VLDREPLGRELRQRPDRRTAHHGGGIVQQGLDRRDQQGVPGIARRIEGVADEAVATDALDRALGEQGAEGGIVQRQQVRQRRRLQRIARLKPGLRRGLGELVPRTGGQTVVAAVDAVARGDAELARPGARILDRQIGDAASGVDLERRRKSLGRTGVQTGGAAAAVLGLGLVRLDFGGGQDRAQK